MNKLNLIKRLIWLMIAIFLLQPVFSSIKTHDHLFQAPPLQSSSLIEKLIPATLEPKVLKSTITYTHHAQISFNSVDSEMWVNCCQSVDMGFCLMGCYFIVSEIEPIIIEFKMIAPLMASFSWTSHFMSADNPPPRLLI